MIDLVKAVDGGRELGANPELVKERIALGRLGLNDPPVNTVSGQTMDIETVRNWFSAQINKFERLQAKEVIASRKASKPRRRTPAGR